MEMMTVRSVQHSNVAKDGHLYRAYVPIPRVLWQDLSCRVVVGYDTEPGDLGKRYVVIEKYDGHDAMSRSRWVPLDMVPSSVVVSMVEALAQLGEGGHQADLDWIHDPECSRCQGLDPDEIEG